MINFVRKGDSKMKKKKIIIAIVIVAVILLGVIAYFIFGKEDKALKESSYFSNEENNINNGEQSGNMAIKIDNYYYIMGKKFFIKVDSKGKVVSDIGKENNTTEFAARPYMQVHGDYIYYDKEGGFYKKIARYNYKTNKREDYTIPKKIQDELVSYKNLASSFYIRGDKLYYQPYSNDYFYIIDLDDNSVSKTESLDVSAYKTVVSFDSNVFDGKLYYSIEKTCNYLDFSNNKSKKIADTECTNIIFTDKNIYYEDAYTSKTYKSDLEGTNTSEIYDGKNGDFATMYKNILYTYSGYYEGREFNIIKNDKVINTIPCEQIAIATDKLICIRYDQSVYSYDLSGNNEQFIYENK